MLGVLHTSHKVLAPYEIEVFRGSLDTLPPLYQHLATLLAKYGHQKQYSDHACREWGT